jgi:hypothetical protein
MVSSIPLKKLLRYLSLKHLFISCICSVGIMMVSSTIWMKDARVNFSKGIKIARVRRTSIMASRDAPDPDTGIRYPVKFRHPALSGIRYKFAGYLPDSTVIYFLTTMKRKSLLGVYKLGNTNNY